MILKNNKFKTANPQTKENKVLKPRVLGNVGIFSMISITITKINTMKKKMV